MGFFETFVALRLLRGVRRQKGFISLSSLFSIAGVAVGVMALIVVIGVMTGFDEDLKKKILSVNPQIIVLSKGGRIGHYDQVAAKIKNTSAHAGGNGKSPIREGGAASVRTDIPIFDKIPENNP